MTYACLVTSAWNMVIIPAITWSLRQMILPLIMNLQRPFTTCWKRRPGINAREKRQRHGVGSRNRRSRHGRWVDACTPHEPIEVQLTAVQKILNFMCLPQSCHPRYIHYSVCLPLNCIANFAFRLHLREWRCVLDNYKDPNFAFHLILRKTTFHTPPASLPSLATTYFYPLAAVGFQTTQPKSVCILWISPKWYRDK